jgi:hypothetical protein
MSNGDFEGVWEKLLAALRGWRGRLADYRAGRRPAPRK